jgi:hypothetical protein
MASPCSEARALSRHLRLASRSPPSSVNGGFHSLEAYLPTRLSNSASLEHLIREVAVAVSTPLAWPIPGTSSRSAPGSGQAPASPVSHAYLPGSDVKPGARSWHVCYPFPIPKRVDKSRRWLYNSTDDIGRISRDALRGSKLRRRRCLGVRGLRTRYQHP